MSVFRVLLDLLLHLKYVVQIQVDLTIIVMGRLDNFTHISLASILWDIGKQCRTRSDDAECSL